MAKDKIEQPKEVEVAKVKPAESRHVSERPKKEGEKDTFHEQPKVLKFKNVGKGMKIKLVDEDKRKFKWITVKHGEVVSIPRKIAQRNKLVEVK